MPRFLRRSLIATLLVLLLALPITVCLLLALAGSESGTRWLAGIALERLAGQAQWQSVQGTLLGRLELRALEFQQPGLDLKARSMVLAWQPRALLHGELLIDALSADGAVIGLSETAEAAAPAVATEPFLPSSVALPLDITLTSMQLQDVQLLLPEQAAQRIDALQLSARLSDGTLDLEQLELRLPQGTVRASGSTALRDRMPLTLTLSAGWLLPLPAEDATTPPQQVPLQAALRLEGELGWGEAVTGALDYRLTLGGAQALLAELPAELVASGHLEARASGTAVSGTGIDTLRLEQLHLALEGSPLALALALAGEMTLPAQGEPQWRAAFDWRGAGWPLFGDAPEVYSEHGYIQLEGSASDYSLSLNLFLDGEQLPTSEWRGQASGNTRSLHVEQLAGTLLGGTVALSGPVSWDPVPAWALQLRADSMALASVLPELVGQFRAQLQTQGTLDPKAGPVATLSLRAANEGVIDTPITLEADARLDGETLQLAGLRLNTEHNRLQASGVLSEQQLALDWALRFTRPQQLLPGAAGQLEGEGELSGSPGAPQLKARLRGAALGYDTLAADSLQLTLTAGLGDEVPLDVQLSLAGLHDAGEPLLEALTLNASGTTALHQIDVRLDTPAAQLQSSLGGGLAMEEMAWRGRVQQLLARAEALGAWQLDAPAALELSAERASLGRSCLRAHRPEGAVDQPPQAGQLCLSGAWQAAGESVLQLALAELSVRPFMAAVSGEVSGTLDATLAADGQIAAQGRFELSPGQVTLPQAMQSRQLAHGGGVVALSAGGSGLEATLAIDAPADGTLAAVLRLPTLRALPLADDVPLQGSLRAALPDLSLIAALVEGVSSTRGEVFADVELGGSLAAPQLTGELQLKDASASIPIAGLELQQIALRAASDPEQPQTITVSGGVSSGLERLELSGDVQLADYTAALRLTGEQFLAFNTADARVRISPNLQLDWSGDLLALSGVVEIPRAEITPKLRLSPGTATDPEVERIPGALIGPSADVVILGVDDAPSAAGEAPLGISLNVALLMGDAVRVNAIGLVTRITGGVNFTLSPTQQDPMPYAQGMISLKDGSFRSFGQDLDIETGQLIFANVPATEPELFLRAVRWIDNDPEVSAAGVLLTGSATAPQLELFSRPQLQTAEIQSYLLTGTATGRRRSTLGIGTYLNERIYVGYGYNLLEETSEFDALFSITPRYGLGLDAGEADSNFNLTFTIER